MIVTIVGLLLLLLVLLILLIITERRIHQTSSLAISPLNQSINQSAKSSFIMDTFVTGA